MLHAASPLDTICRSDVTRALRANQRRMERPQIYTDGTSSWGMVNMESPPSPIVRYPAAHVQHGLWRGVACTHCGTARISG